jgi:hypothetical protein
VDQFVEFVKSGIVEVISSYFLVFSVMNCMAINAKVIFNKEQA